MGTHDGGKPSVKPLRYSPPKGPTNQMRCRPGLGGEVNRSGSQGSYGHVATSGSPGLHGKNKGVGSQK